MKLDDLVREARAEEPKPDWQAIDAKLFARLDIERASAPSPRMRTVGPWPAIAATFAAAAAVALLIHSSGTQGPDEARVSERSAALAGDRIEPAETAYFDQAGVQWMAAAGSSIGVEHGASPLLLSLERGSTEAQVTPVLSGEAFAVDVTASSGAIVRVAVHGTHLRVAREGDRVSVDLTEGVVSIGAPPRRGSLIGTLVTAPAHVSFDAKDLTSIRVDHASLAVRAPEAVRAPQHTVVASNEQPPVNAVAQPATQAVMPPALVTSPSVPSRAVQGAARILAVQSEPAADTTEWLHTTGDVVNAIEACARLAPNTEFKTSLTMRIGDDGRVQADPIPRFTPPLPPEARDCAVNVIYKRIKLENTTRDVAIPIEMKP